VIYFTKIDEKAKNQKIVINHRIYLQRNAIHEHCNQWLFGFLASEFIATICARPIPRIFITELILSDLSIYTTKTTKIEQRTHKNDHFIFNGKNVNSSFISSGLWLCF